MLRRLLTAWLVAAACPTAVLAQESTEALAKKLQNPIAALISVPLQSNFEFNVGNEGDGFRYTLNVQPVVPITLTSEWNLISRTILPITYEENVVPGTSQFGLGDTLQSFFLSPAKPGPAGLVWGVGPALHRDGQPARGRQVGRRPHRRPAGPARGLDLRDPRQPRLVVRWAPRPPGCEPDVHPALPVPHVPQCLQSGRQHLRNLLSPIELFRRPR